MNKDPLDAIRAMIRAGDYQRAQAALKELNTPEARRLLMGLDAAAPTATDRAMRHQMWFWLAMLIAMSVFVVAAGVLVYVLSQPSPERFDVKFGTAGVTTERSYEGEIDIVVRGTGVAPDGRTCDAYYIFEDAEGQPVEPPEAYPCLMINGGPASALWAAHRDYDPDHAYRVTFEVPEGALIFSAPEVAAGEGGEDAFAIEVHE